MNGIFDDIKSAFRKPDNALMQLILINVIVFLALAVIRVTLSLFFKIEWVADAIEKHFLLPAAPLQFLYRPWTALTYAFNHAGFMHILFNMLFLYWFGFIIVEYLGSKRVISLYVLGALAGAISFFILYQILLPLNQFGGAYLVGASAAVYAVMVGAATITPNYQFNLLLIGPVRIKYIAAFYIVVSYIGLNGGNTGGNLAHLFGALIGYIYIIQLKRGSDIGKWIISILDGIQDLFRKKPKIKVTYSKPKTKVTTHAYHGHAKNSADRTPDEEEINAILDKISESGYGSLTKEEKEKLFRASKS